MYKIGIIFNPFAGNNKKKAVQRRSQLEKILGNRGVIYETTNMADLDRAAHEFHEANIEILGICGGDGTNHRVLTAFYKIYTDRELPLIGLLRGGTMNLLETSLGMKGNPENRLKKLVQVADSGKYPVISHTLLCVNGKFGYIFGNGVIANFLHEYYQNGTPSLGQAVATFARTFWSAITGGNCIARVFKPIQAHVQVNDCMLPGTNFSALMAATEKECGFGFKPFYRAREEQGKFHFLALNMQPQDVLQHLAKFRAGKKVTSDSMYEVVTDKVMIETFEPYHYTIDGEMLNSTKTIALSAGPVVKLIMV
jgi:diacylglycerol kinase family enzyme